MHKILYPKKITQVRIQVVKKNKIKKFRFWSKIKKMKKIIKRLRSKAQEVRKVIINKYSVKIQKQ